MTATLSVQPSLINGAIKTYQQMGGYGLVQNTLLGLRGHLNGPDEPQGPWNSAEYVHMSVCDGQRPTQIGEHTQATDEIYYLLSGRGLLITNGQEEWVEAGTLVAAPRGTRHTILNHSTKEPVSFLVVELVAPERGHPCPPLLIRNLPAQVAASSAFHSATHPFQVARVDLAAVFGGESPWGTFSLVRLPAGVRIAAYGVVDADELLLVPPRPDEVSATISVDGQPFRSESYTKSIGMFASLPGEGLSVVVPAGRERAISNDCLGLRPGERGKERVLDFISLEVRRVAVPQGRSRNMYEEARV